MATAKNRPSQGQIPRHIEQTYWWWRFRDGGRLKGRGLAETTQKKKMHLPPQDLKQNRRMGIECGSSGGKNRVLFGWWV